MLPKAEAGAGSLDLIAGVGYLPSITVSSSQVCTCLCHEA